MTGAPGVPDAGADELARLDEACFPAPERWSAAAWDGELRAGDRIIGVRRVDGRLVAAATVQVVAGDADLHRILVDPAHRGQGLAGGLLEEMVARASRRAGRMLLEVRPDNAAALALYRRAGFAVIARRASYYGPGVDALVMELTLAPHPEGQAGTAADARPDAGVSAGVCHAGDEPREETP
ncbi:MAG TPA: GNAT family N-acetyltransferase [Propionibacteriaceae bacterium]|nr:GNAT family N-acetyltransferase [Propionibacteriaceae bacterium]